MFVHMHAPIAAVFVLFKSGPAQEMKPMLRGRMLKFLLFLTHNQRSWLYDCRGCREWLECCMHSRGMNTS